MTLPTSSKTPFTMSAHECLQRGVPFINPQEYRDALRERFHKVILGAGYSENAAQEILDQHFDEYMKDVATFNRMLIEYETKTPRE